MKTQCVVVGLMLIGMTLGVARAQPSAGSSVPVTADNFNRAESDQHFKGIVDKGGFGKFVHQRAPMSIYDQTVPRANRDVLRSTAVFDLDAGPVTITMPDAGKRLMSLMAISEDHYIPTVAYGAGSYTFTRQQIGTRYVMFVISTEVNPEDPADVQKVNRLQEAVNAGQKGPGRFEVPDWDEASLRTVDDALKALGATLPDLKGAFGSQKDVDPVRHLIGTAVDWEGVPEKDGISFIVKPPSDNASSVYRLSAKDVPVDAFWSITLYNPDGYFTSNPLNAYSLSNITAKKGEDGSVLVQFGGCDGTVPNCLPTVPGWYYMVRLYRPRAEVLSGKWKFPEPQPVS